MIVVTQGLKAHENVIVEGFQRVRQGITVSAKPYPEAPKTEGAKDVSEKKSSASPPKSREDRSDELVAG